MKLAKFLVLSLFICFISITTLPASSNAFPLNEGNQSISENANSIEYRYIEDRLYMVILDDDGKVIVCEAVED